MPQAGVKEKYRVTEWYAGTPENQRDSTKVKWAVYYQKEGKYILKLQKEIGEFTFYEQAIGKDIRVVGYLYSPELDNDSALPIKVVSNPTPSITSLALYDINKTNPLPRNAKLKLGQSLYVVANTTNSVGKKIEFTLLKKEEKAAGSEYIPITQKTEKVCTKGTATTVFYFDDLRLLMSGEKRLKYRVNAQLEDSETTYIFENGVEIENPHPSQPTLRKETVLYKGTSAIQEGWNKLKESYKKLTTSEEPQIQRVSLYIPENKTKVSYGEYIKLKIEGKYLKGQNVEYSVYEDDFITKDELDSGIVHMNRDVHELAIQLTQEMYKKGGTDWYELMDGTHEIFVRVKLKGKTPIQSTGIIEVDTTVMKMETIPGNRAVTTGKPDRKEEKKEKCVCEARVRAFMRMLRVKEGTEGESGYKKRYGGTFTDMRTHPQIKTTSGGYTSSAAGAYQIMGYTYDWLNGKEFDKKNKPTGGYNKNHDYIKKYNIPDFTQESQDKLCVIILKHKRSSNFLDLITQNKIQEALEKYGSYEWASLPPSRYGQPNQTMENALSNYNKFLKLELLGKSDLHLKKDFLKDFGYTCGSCSIKSDISSTCKLCHKKHIDLSTKVVWQTQFNPKWGDKKAQNSACKKLVMLY